jgi:hypothetical protein
MQEAGHVPMNLTIREPEELLYLIDGIHDRWFDVTAIAYDPDSRVIRIPFWSQQGRRYPRNRATGEPLPFDSLLAIHDADEPAVEDREHIEIYSFNDVAVSDRQVVVRADPNVRITCEVGDLHIAVSSDRDWS